MVEVLLDASAFLAWSMDEAGADRVEVTLPAAGITSVNAAEAMSKLDQLGMSADIVRESFARSGILVLDFTEEDARACAEIHARTRNVGLSLGDCACLGSARSRTLPALTADRVWQDLDVGVAVRVIR